MKVLDLFSGIGGFSLGLERVGFETIAFCEIDEYARKILKKHWPAVPIYEDVKDVTAKRLQADGIRCDVITAGWPCQDISHAGKQAGIEGERSGLWAELARIIGEVRPRFTIMENVPALLSGDRGRWFGRVLGDLAEIGYDCEWHCIPASHIGAPHRRDRVWVIAYTNTNRSQKRKHDDKNGEETPSGEQQGGETVRVPSQAISCDPRCWQRPSRRLSVGIRREIESLSRGRDWEITTEPVLGRGVDGIPPRLDRLRCLGNAIVPQIAEIIGKVIYEQHHHHQ